MTDGQKALEWFRERRTAVAMRALKEMYNEAVKALEELEKRGEGEWIVGKDEHGVTCGHCSHCGMVNYAGKTNYCPNCGAKMTEDKT